MSNARVEHANITVLEPLATANMLVDLFGWSIRWQGAAIHGGFTVHVGGEDSYLALYTKDSDGKASGRKSSKLESENTTYDHLANLNHVGIVVDDLESTELRVKKAGFTTYSHADYEPGVRFYFRDHDGLEFEVVSYP